MAASSWSRATRELVILRAFKILLILSVAALMVHPFVQLFLPHNDWQASIEKNIPPGAKVFSEGYVALIRARRFDEVLKATDPDFRKLHPEERLSVVAAAFPQGAPRSIKPVGVDMFKDAGKGTLCHLLLEYEFTNRWVGVEIMLSQNQGHFLVEGFNALLLPDSAEHANRFTFSGKGARNYAAFAIAVIVLMFDFCIFMHCVNRPAFRKQWFWAAFILIGIFQVDFNWTLGKLILYGEGDGRPYNFLYIGLPAIQFFQAAYNTLILRFSLPLGALLYLWRSPARTE